MIKKMFQDVPFLNDKKIIFLKIVFEMCFRPFNFGKTNFLLKIEWVTPYLARFGQFHGF